MPGGVPGQCGGSAIHVMLALCRSPRQVIVTNKPHSTEFSGGAPRYSQYVCYFNTLPPPCLIRTHHRRQVDETWHRPPKRHAKTAPSPSISRTHPPTSS